MYTYMYVRCDTDEGCDSSTRYCAYCACPLLYIARLQWSLHAAVTTYEHLAVVGLVQLRRCALLDFYLDDF